jgi:cysteine-rich repeat protein
MPRTSLALILGVIPLLLPLESAAKTPRPSPCAGGRFVLSSEPLVAGDSSPINRVIVISGSGSDVGGVCTDGTTTISGRYKHQKLKATHVTAKWTKKKSPCAGGVPARLTATISAACNTVTGTFTVKKSHRVQFSARLSACGDGVLDPGTGEQCDDGNTVDSDGCDSDCKPSRFQSIAHGDQTPPGTGVEVVLDGSLNIGEDGTPNGSIVATFGAGGRATINAPNAQTLSIETGGSVIDMLPDDNQHIAVDGAMTDVTTAGTIFLSDIQSGQDASVWSPVSQAVLALAALTSTPEWASNVASVLNGGARTARSSGRLVSRLLPQIDSWWCKATVTGAYWILMGAEPAFCDLASGAACTAVLGTTTLGSLVVPCAYLLNIVCSDLADNALELVYNDLLALWTGGSKCGNGTLDAGEQCDGSNLNSQSCASQGFPEGGTLRCNGTCTGFDTSGCYRCGNGIREAGEQCDGSSSGCSSGQTCTSSCTCAGAPACGNGTIDPGEQCDGSHLNGQSCASRAFPEGGTLRCNGTCSGFDTSGCYRCGNGVREGSEQCDGSAVGCPSGQLCTSSCTCAGSVCGNGTIDPGEECDGSDLNGQSCASQGFPEGGTLRCNSTCTGFDFSGCYRCGNGTCDPGETPASCPGDCPSCAASGNTDDIPGTCISYPPNAIVSGGVDSETHPNVVYSVRLSAGKGVAFSATSTACGLTVNLLAPSSTSIQTNLTYTIVASMYPQYGYPCADSFDYVPATDGTYYVWITTSVPGDGFTLKLISDGTMITDNGSPDIPGAPIVGLGDTVGVVDAATKPNDVYAIHLSAGIVVAFSATSKTCGLTVNLLAPTSTSIQTSLTYSILESMYPQYGFPCMDSFAYVPPTGGDGLYYLWVSTTSNGDAFTLHKILQ